MFRSPRVAFPVVLAILWGSFLGDGVAVGEASPAPAARPAAAFHLFAGGVPSGAEVDLPPGDAPQPEPQLGTLLAEDFRTVLTSPRRLGKRGWTAAALVGVGLGALVESETGDVDSAPAEKDDIGQDVLNTFEPLGGEGSLAVLGGFYLAGRIFHDRRASGVAVDGAIASLIASGLITPALKEALGRSRPRDNPSATDFHPFSGNASFPSGHTTQAFAVASVIASEYDSRWVDGAAYGTASLVGLARIQEDAHYLSDVVAGALIGTLVGRTVARRNQAIRGVQVEVSPLLNPEAGAGVSLSLRWPSAGEETPRRAPSGSRVEAPGGGRVGQALSPRARVRSAGRG